MVAAMIKQEKEAVVNVMRKGKVLLIVFLFVKAIVCQTSLTDQDFTAWRQNNINFVLFDIRGEDPVDSIIYPCFYTTAPEQWIDSLRFNGRLLITCYTGKSADKVAKRIIQNGYPKDSVYTSGIQTIVSSRFPAKDTLCLSMLKKHDVLPQSITAYELKSVLLSRNSYKLVDVRTVRETEAGMIPGACNIVWPDGFGSSLDKLGKEDNIILYCRSGSRAGQAKNHLLEKGYSPEKVINFGGFGKWKTAGLPAAAKPSSGCVCPGIELRKHSARTHHSNRVVAVCSNGYLRVRSPDSGELLNTALYNISGRLAGKFLNTSQESYASWETGNLSSGIYLLNIITEHFEDAVLIRAR